MKRFVLISALLVICLIILQTSVFAGKISTGKFSYTDPNNSTVKLIGGRLIRIFQLVATLVSIGALLFVGIKLMLASPAEKASVKSHSVPYIVGAVMCFAIVPILQIFYDIAQKFK